jgi:hypothetical protein
MCVELPLFEIARVLVRFDHVASLTRSVAKLEGLSHANIFQEALEFSRFENMQKLEAAGAFDSNILHPGDVRDPESFKVRRGKVGGYREYLSLEDQKYAADALMKLDPRFGYNS